LKSGLLSILVCPACHKTLNVHIDRADDGEIMEGSLSCTGCPAQYPILRGIPRFLSHGLTEGQKATADAFGYEWTH
jgi:uncharacterized protein YbaR (Trm112 family)